MTAIESVPRRAALSLLSRLRGGFVELAEPDGRRFLFGDPKSELAARLEVRSPAFYRSLLVQILFAKPGRSLDATARASATRVMG